MVMGAGAEDLRVGVVVSVEAGSSQILGQLQVVGQRGGSGSWVVGARRLVTEAAGDMGGVSGGCSKHMVRPGGGMEDGRGVCGNVMGINERWWVGDGQGKEERGEQTPGPVLWGRERETVPDTALSVTDCAYSGSS